MKFKKGDKVAYKYRGCIYRGKISTITDAAISIKVNIGGYRFAWFKYGDEKRLRIVK